MIMEVNMEVSYLMILKAIACVQAEREGSFGTNL